MEKNVGNVDAILRYIFGIFLLWLGLYIKRIRRQYIWNFGRDILIDTFYNSYNQKVSRFLNF